jgi:FkbM family methyltransferase
VVNVISELESLLAADIDSIITAEATEFDRIAEGRPIVLMGAGGLGRRTLAGLRVAGIEPLAFADNDRRKQGTSVDGVAVLSPNEAVRAFGHRAVFVITIWGAHSAHRMAHSRRQLSEAGCDCMCSFVPLFRKYRDGLLPFYLHDRPSRLLRMREDVRRALDVWADDASRAEYVAQVRFRLLGDFECLAHPVQHLQYFPSDLFDWSDDERFVDGGAYDGDTIRAIIGTYGDRFGQIYAFEPDPLNFDRLCTTVHGLPDSARRKIVCRQSALGATNGSLHIEVLGSAASRTHNHQSEGTLTIAAESLDALNLETVSFLKFDIEGHEIDALTGAQRTIERGAPILAVCVYHQQDHLWRIPLLLKQWRDDYRFFLRPHNEEGWDLVCYAIPVSRDRRASA